MVLATNISSEGRGQECFQFFWAMGVSYKLNLDCWYEDSGSSEYMIDQKFRFEGIRPKER